MRACEPLRDGLVDRDGVLLHWEIYREGPGEGSPTIVLLPTWSIIHSAFWKAQIPYLARHYRVVTWDGRGNGRSNRPEGSAAYTHTQFAADGLAVMDATGTDRAILVALSRGALWGAQLAADQPDRVLGLVSLSPAVPLAPGLPERQIYGFDEKYEATEGWAKFNAAYWQRDYEDFVRFFAGRMFTEPHSTKQIEDCVGWALETDPTTLTHTTHAMQDVGQESFASICQRARCPVLVIHGDEDAIQARACGPRLAEVTGGSLVTIGGAGHAPQARDPVFVNTLIRQFVDSVVPPPPRHRTWTRARRRPQRALYVSSPIGLGHAQRDVAIADELRKLHPDLQIDWLAQHPVTKVLEARGERIHPASAYLASESAAVESEAAEHDLHAFQAIRRMDDTLVNNFMVFADLVRDEPYDLWIGDEAWDIDYFLHENPELKNTAFVWMTDFVGWLPMPSGGVTEAALTADYNAEMIEQRARFRRIRDRSIFVGDPEDIVPDRFGPDLPAIRSWTEQNFDFAGYVTGFDPAAYADRAALRAELGYRPDERVCLVTVGGSGVGTALLHKVIAAHPLAAEKVDGLRTVVVAGPRIDVGSMPIHPGLEVHGYVPELYRHLAACDLAVVQGGLTTCMELTANRRPFLYFPLANHFEQNFHVRHRLDRHRAGVLMDYRESDPESIAGSMAAAIGQDVDYRPVEAAGAQRAATLIAEVL
ncbi:MAG: alpha/beta fold hydrolase [Actinomycetota bacterium]|nr:alpha/beta fold hydrolase [Actinomycetota bacterium]